MSKAFIAQWIPKIDAYIEQCIQEFPDHQQRLKEAMLYAIQAGGKRLRANFVLLANGIAKGNFHDVIPVASAIEMIHTYSLIHDDLPGMDDDELRRGKPTVHIAFDEATAILAGDAFLTLAFETLVKVNQSPEVIVELIRLISNASGGKGMIAGQMLDIAAEEQHLTLEQLKNVHEEKTGKLILAAILAGVACGEKHNHNNQLMKQFAIHFGLGFQIQNDLQDVCWDSSQTGKMTGKDQQLSKNTYPSLLTIEGAKKALQVEHDLALDALMHLELETKLQEESRRCLTEMLKHLTI